MKSFLELKEMLDSGGLSDYISKDNGIYLVYMPQDFEVRVKPSTDAVQSYMKNGQEFNLVYSLEKLNRKLEKVQIIQDNTDEKILYIGKAEREHGLLDRITEFVKYSYGLCNNHRGGRALWQLEESKSLLLDFIVCNDSENEERRFLSTFKQECNTYPFANWRL